MAIKIQKNYQNNVQYNFLDNNKSKKSAVPSFGYTIKNEKLIGRVKNLSDNFTSAQQRLWMGFTALMSQPFFDIYNKRVDEDTRTVSCARTIGKIVAGSLTGITIRWGCIKALDSYCKTDATEAEKVAKKGKNGIKYVKREFSRKEQWFLPKIDREISLKEIKRYKNAFGTLAATFIMVFTNFLIDAPLTTHLTNVLTKRIKTPHNKSKTPQQNIQKGDS